MSSREGRVFLPFDGSGVGGWYQPVGARYRTPFFTYYLMSKAAQGVQNFLTAAIQSNLIDKLKAEIPDIADFPSSLSERAVKLPLEKLPNQLKISIRDQAKHLLDAWKAGIGAGMGSSYAQAIEQYYNTGTLLYAYSNLQYSVSVIPRMRRYYLSKYTPTIPDDYMAWLLWKRGKIKEADFNRYASYEGWDKKGIGYLKEAWRTIPNIWATAKMYLAGAIDVPEYYRLATMNGWDYNDAQRIITAWLTYPSTREAFYMHRRGIIDETSRNKIYMAQGYLKSWWPLISLNYQHIPNPLNAFKLLMRRGLTTKQYSSYIYQNGWPLGWDALFYRLHQNIPTSHEAFFMWVKGLLTTDQRNAAYQAYGWDSAWHDNLTQNYYYVPTVYDLFRLADYVELDEIWATSVCKRRGVSDEDIAKIIPALRMRPLKNEIARQISVWVDRYELGWASAVELEAAFDALIADGYMQTTEKTLVTAEAELKYEDELMREVITIQMWYFRTGVITEAQYLANLMSIGIRREKANLMVEEQKAMGYYGYY